MWNVSNADVCSVKYFAEWLEKKAYLPFIKCNYLYELKCKTCVNHIKFQLFTPAFSMNNINWLNVSLHIYAVPHTYVGVSAHIRQFLWHKTLSPKKSKLTNFYTFEKLVFLLIYPTRLYPPTPIWIDICTHKIIKSGVFRRV